MTAPAFGTVRAEIPRGDGGRPLIRIPDSDDVVEYDRASSFSKAIDNGAGLTYWAKCMVLKGAAQSPSIIKAARPLEYDTEKSKLHELAEQAMVLAGAGNKASEGTALHSYTELIDLGRELPKGLEPEIVRDLDAYRRVTAGLTYPGVEEFVVVDEVRVAGTFDRLITVPDADPWPAWLRGRTCIGDLKTGNAEGAIAGILVQLALYSRGQRYNPETGERTPLEVDQHVGLVVHLPLNKGVAQIIAVDLDLGWQGVLAAQAAGSFQKAAKLTCKSCDQGSGFYKNGRPCRSCKGVKRTPCGVTVVAA